MTARLALEDVTVGYAGRELVGGIDLELVDGSTTCLMGPNGVGKTTLFRTILGLLPPLRGRILVGGRDISAMRRDTVARRIAHVPQAYQGDPTHTVLDIVVMGRTAHLGMFSTPGSEDYAAARHALDVLGVADLADRSADRISGGQRQLMLIARALAQETEIILMDEPTASLDLGNRLALLDRVRALAANGLSLLVSTHEPDHAFDIADRVAVMGRERRFEVGMVDQILTSDRLGALYGIDLRLETTPSGRRVISRLPGAVPEDGSTPCRGRGNTAEGPAVSVIPQSATIEETNTMAPHPLAVVVHTSGDPLEEVLAAARDRLAARPGVRLGGLIPRYGDHHSNGRASLWLDDVMRGDTIALSQDLGPGSTSCILDADGLAMARMRLAEAVAARPDLVFFGRFAKEEIAGRGIREEIGLAAGEGIPALVAVEESSLPGWTEFAGDEWTPLPVDAEAIVAWFTALQPAEGARASL